MSTYPAVIAQTSLLGADQAHGLRILAAQTRTARPPVQPSMSGRSLVLAVTSGKGGVGKTSVVVNLAVLLSQWGKRVMILDCDLGTANVDVMMGMYPRYGLEHVLRGQRRLEDVIVEGPANVRFIAGASGLREMADLSTTRREAMVRLLGDLDGQADALLLDTGAGISANVLRFVQAVEVAVVITTPEPTACTDAYALIKVASQPPAAGRQPSGTSYAEPSAGDAMILNGVLPGELSETVHRTLHPRPDTLYPRFKLLVNMARDAREAEETSRTLVDVAREYLGMELEGCGYLPIDPAVPQAVRRQVPFVLAYPHAPAAGAMARLAARLTQGASTAAQTESGWKRFLHRVMGMPA